MFDDEEFQPAAIAITRQFQHVLKNVQSYTQVPRAVQLSIETILRQAAHAAVEDAKAALYRDYEAKPWVPPVIKKDTPDQIAQSRKEMGLDT